MQIMRCCERTVQGECKGEGEAVGKGGEGGGWEEGEKRGGGEEGVFQDTSRSLQSHGSRSDNQAADCRGYPATVTLHYIGPHQIPRRICCVRGQADTEIYSS